MQTWTIGELSLRAHHPQILASTDEGRAIVLLLPAGERLAEHEVHERAWLLVVEGELELSSPEGQRAVAGAGTLCTFAPQERHEVRAREDSRLLLLLTPWPGEGHPGAMSLDDKATVRERA